MDNPLVRNTSIGSIDSKLILGSLSRERVRTINELSSPKADSGTVALKSKFCGIPGIRFGLLFCAPSGAIDQPLGRFESSHDKVQSSVLEPVASSETVTISVLPGDILGI